MFKVSWTMPSPAKTGVAMNEQRQARARLRVRRGRALGGPKAVLLDPHTTQRDRIDKLQVARIEAEGKMDGTPVAVVQSLL